MTELEATRAKLKCLEMVEGTELNWWNVVRMKSNKGLFVESSPDFMCYEINIYEFALGVVEGKPVWEGDEIYRLDGHKFTACEYGMSRCDHNKLSWNPPQPKTVMVELLIEDAEDMARQRAFDSARIAVACRKALEG